jgi:uncharacterized protein YggE
MRQRVRWIVPALAICGLGMASVQAQDVRQPVVAAEQMGLTTHGHAELKVKPDIAYISIGVVTQDGASAKAVQDNATQATALLKALREANLADKDIQSQFYSVQPQYNYQVSPAVLTGYQVTNNFRVTVRDLSKVGSVIDAATQAGGNQVNDVTFDLADRNEAEGRALAQAVAEAKSKASVMAQAAGVSLGRLMDLSEGSGGPVFQPFVLQRNAMLKAPAPETPVQPQEVSVTADVTAFYAIGL